MQKPEMFEVHFLCEFCAKEINTTAPREYWPITSVDPSRHAEIRERGHIESHGPCALHMHLAIKAANAELDKMEAEKKQQDEIEAGKKQRGVA